MSMSCSQNCSVQRSGHRRQATKSMTGKIPESFPQVTAHVVVAPKSTRLTCYQRVIWIKIKQPMKLAERSDLRWFCCCSCLFHSRTQSLRTRSGQSERVSVGKDCGYLCTCCASSETRLTSNRFGYKNRDRYQRAIVTPIYKFRPVTYAELFVLRSPVPREPMPTYSALVSN